MLDLRLKYKKVSEIISQCRHVLLVASPPDGDSIGSTLAFSRYLEGLGKRHRIFCKMPVPSSLRFLPGAENVFFDRAIFKEKRFDCVVVFDAGDLKYAGIDFLENNVEARPNPAQAMQNRPQLISFDHHSYNQLFADINVVDSSASSTTQIIYNFFNQNRIHINKEMATCLLTGILFDTGGFSNPATTFESLEIAAALLKKGVRFKKVAAQTLKNKSINTLRLWGEALMRLRLNPKYGIATTIITQKDMVQFQTSEEDVEGIANFLNSLDGVNAVLVLKELAGGKIKGSFRTSRPGIDVSRLAVACGGGGHQKAAGFTVPVNLIKDDDYWKID